MELGLPVLEAGIEEALTQMYYNGTNLGVNGWQLVNGAYLKQRQIPNGMYMVTISSDIPPVTKAYVCVPFSTNYLDPPRTVRVTVTNAPMFAKGMVAKGQINLNGNNIRTDSFDSGDPNYSTNGRYDPNKFKTNGDVATDSTLTNSLNVGNADLWGHASTGPGGSVSIGSNGSVGDSAWHAAGNTGVEPGWTSNDMNVQFPDVTAPFSGGATVTGTATLNGHYNFHYDENLGRVGPRRGYTVNSWNEIFSYSEL